MLRHVISVAVVREWWTFVAQKMLRFINIGYKKSGVFKRAFEYLGSLNVRDEIGTGWSLPHYILFNEHFSDEKKSVFINDMKVYDDFITEEEEMSMYNEVEPHMKRLRYEKSHWDNAIEGYREIERQHWNSVNTIIIERVKKLAFTSGTEPLKKVHVLDLIDKGVIKPHIDSVKFCGNVISGISLLSDSVMRLRLDKQRNEFADILLRRRSLYIMTGIARYDYTHEILGNNDSLFGNEIVRKGRRISIICRNEP